MAWTLETLPTWESDATTNDGHMVLCKNMLRTVNDASRHKWTTGGLDTSTDVTHVDGLALYAYDGFAHVPTYSGTTGVASLYYNALLDDADVDAIVVKPTAALQAGGTLTVAIADNDAFSTNLRTIATINFGADSTRLVSLSLLDASAVAGFNRYRGVTYIRFKFELSSGNWTTAPRIGEIFVGRRRQLGWKPNRPYDDELDVGESEDFISRAGYISTHVFHEGRTDKRGTMTLVVENKFGGADITVARTLMEEARRNTVCYWESPGTNPNTVQFGKYLMQQREMPLQEPFERSWDFDFREIPPFMRAEQTAFSDEIPSTFLYSLESVGAGGGGGGTDLYYDFGIISGLQAATAATWSFWWQPREAFGNQRPIWSAYASNQNQFSFTKSSLGRVFFKICPTLTTDAQFTSDASVFVQSVWQHIVVVYNGAGATNADRLKIYKNGTLVTGTYSGTIPAAMTTTTNSTRIGMFQDLSTPAMTQYIDECAIWIGTAISAANVTTLYNGGVLHDYTLVGFGAPTHYWQFEQSLRDRIGNADGTGSTTPIYVSDTPP